MKPASVIILTSLTMIGFAGNSLICRMALTDTSIDACSFTTIRILSGALSLWILVRIKGTENGKKGSWLSALTLFIYAAFFSFAYVSLSASTGALLLFGAVQVSMISRGLWSGEKLGMLQCFGLFLALAGIVGLLLPGLSAPPLRDAFLMIAAGIAWGIYSLRGRGQGNPTTITAGNFLRAVPIAVAMSIVMSRQAVWDFTGILYAFVSGAVASGLVYAIWYSVLPELKATSAGIVQLSVPVIAALGGILLLDEQLTMRFVLASLATLSGILLAIFEKHQAVHVKNL
ncbi:MAG: DMT family transporter [Desulfobulbaceae bacterium]|nr:DMT family transporter [Desulfobulbaceae bacterium]